MKTASPSGQDSHTKAGRQFRSHFRLGVRPTPTPTSSSLALTCPLKHLSHVCCSPALFCSSGVWPAVHAARMRFPWEQGVSLLHPCAFRRPSPQRSQESLDQLTDSSLLFSKRTLTSLEPGSQTAFGKTRGVIYIYTGYLPICIINSIRGCILSQRRMATSGRHVCSQAQKPGPEGEVGGLGFSAAQNSYWE